MRNITVHMGSNGPKVSVSRTETPGTWELEWTGDTEQRYARRMLKAAENAILRNGGERLVLTCSANQEVLRAELDKWPPSIISKTGDRYAMELITPGEDGVHSRRRRLPHATGANHLPHLRGAVRQQPHQATTGRLRKERRPKGDSQA